MKQEKTVINGIELFVQITGKANETIILLHGNSMSADYWAPQLKDKKLTDKFRLLAIDLPGHGRSEWLINSPERYQLDQMALLIEPLLKAYDINNYLLVGFSLGTNIIGEIKSPLPGCKGIFLASACIVNDEYPPSNVITASNNAHVVATPYPSDEELKGYAYHHEKNKEFADRFIEDYKKTDPRFREQLAHLIMTSGWSDELKNIESWNVPVLIIFGTDDPLVRKDYLDNYSSLWRQKVFFIQKAGHMLTIDKPEKFNKLLFQFAEDVFR